MKLKEDYVIYESGEEESIAVATGESATVFNGLLRANKTAAFIMECLGEETTEEEIVSRMLERFDADEQNVRSDVREILDVLRSAAAIEE